MTGPRFFKLFAQERTSSFIIFKTNYDVILLTIFLFMIASTSANVKFFENAREIGIRNNFDYLTSQTALLDIMKYLYSSRKANRDQRIKDVTPEFLTVKSRSFDGNDKSHCIFSIFYPFFQLRDAVSEDG